MDKCLSDDGIFGMNWGVDRYEAFLKLEIHAHSRHKINGLLKRRKEAVEVACRHRRAHALEPRICCKNGSCHSHFDMIKGEARGLETLEFRSIPVLQKLIYGSSTKSIAEACRCCGFWTGLAIGRYTTAFAQCCQCVFWYLLP